MSKYDPSKQVLERLKTRENKRDWSTLDKSYENHMITRRWSAESNRGQEETQRNWKNTHISPRKPHSPQYLPRLDGAASSVELYDANHDLRHGKLNVVPPVRTRRNEAFTEHKTLGQRNHRQYKVPDHRPEQEVLPNAAYPVGVSVPPWFREMQGQALAYPPAMYSVPMVPMYPGYAPAFMPQVMPDRGYYGERRGYERNGRPWRHLTRWEAAVVVQKHFRGWQVRKGARFAPLRSMCNWKFAPVFIDSLIEELLREDIIPDLLIEAFSHKKYLSTRDPRYQASESVCRDIIHHDVTVFIQQTAAGVFYSHIQLPGKLPKHDPLYQVCDDLISDTVQQAARDLVHTTICALVQSHMTISKSDDWLDDLICETIQPIICLVAREAVDNYGVEAVIDELVDEVVAPIQQAVVVETWREVVEASRDVQVTKVCQYAKDQFLDGLCLQHLLGQLAGDNLSLYFKDYTDQVMDGLICGVLTQQYLAVEDEKEETLSNSMLKEYHQEVFSDVALDVLLEELTANLDEDIQDLMELEKERHRFEL